MRHLFRVIPVMVCCLLVLSAGGAVAQSQPAGGKGRLTKQQSQRQQEQNNELQRLERERAKLLNHERWTKLKQDTDQLLKLATELKQQVETSNEHMLSVSVMNKAEQIEKLAKNVKERMRGY